MPLIDTHVAQSLTVFDYRVDEASASMVPWSTVLQPYKAVPGAPFASLYVPTAETVGLQFLVDCLQANRHHVMLVGNTGTCHSNFASARLTPHTAGTGKTALLQQHLSAADPNHVTTCVLSLNSLTTAPTLQPLLEAPLEKKTGTQYGAPGSRRLVYLVDDLNMPAKDKYDTQVCEHLYAYASKGQ